MLRVSLFALLLVITACGGTTNPTGPNGSNAPEDTSVGGLVAASIGGALSSNLSVAAGSATSKTTTALNPCPTFRTLAGPYCIPVDANTVNFIYISCHLADSMAEWTGVLQVSSDSAIACGTIPSSSLNRQFVTSSTDFTPGGGLRAANGLTIELDHRTANLGNYQGDIIGANIGNGYGMRTIWNGGVRTGIDLRQRIYASGLFDHSVLGSVTISETSGSTTRSASGTVTVYHNILRVKATATLSSLVYSNNCCSPTSGSITTTYTSTSQSGAAGRALNGLSETIQFTGCGAASFTDTQGRRADVSLTQCY